MFDVSSFSPAADRPMVAGTFGSQGSPSVIVEPQSLSSGLQDFWQFYLPEMMLLCGKKKKEEAVLLHDTEREGQVANSLPYSAVITQKRYYDIDL